MPISYVDRATGQLAEEHPPNEAYLRFLYHDPFAASALLPLAKQQFVSEWYGKAMDTAASASKIPDFIASLDVDMSDVRREVGEFETFNDFFARRLKPGARDIGPGLVSPGDGKVLAFEDASAINEFYVKGRAFTLGEFLGEETLAERYHGSAMVILRIAPRDYHRYHFPLAGTPAAAEDLGEDYYSVSPISREWDFAAAFAQNRRQRYPLALDGGGELMMVAVGATLVGSIHATYEPGTPAEKGADMGHFDFGGSSVVLLFDGGRYRLCEDLLANTGRRLETYVRLGETLAEEV